MIRQCQSVAGLFLVVLLFWSMTTTAWAQRINAITFDKLPQDYQLYPRNAQSEAQIPVAGRVNEANWQYVSVSVFRNKQAIGYKRSAITYSAGVGRFTIEPITIKAEKAEYDIQVYLLKENDSINVVNRTNIVAGDVYVFAGQSNASTYFKETRINEYCRTFGKTSGTYGVEPSDPADTTWALSNQTALVQNVGTFGFEFQQLILERYGIPTCLINGAAHWSMMAHFADRTPTNPADLTNRYGRLLYRLQKGGVANSVRALVYRQGESEAYGEGNNWGGNFDTFYKNLRLDLPSIKQLYVFQIDIIDPAVAAAPLVRESQRVLIDKYADVQVLPSVGTVGFDGLHYSDEGYAQNAQELMRLVARDFYSATDVDNIDAPNVRRAFYSSKAHNEITIEFADEQTLVWTEQFGRLFMSDFFYVDGRAGEVTAGKAIGNWVVLTLKNPMTATKLTYLPPKIDPLSPDFPYRGPYVTNKRGMRALSFYEVPIDPQAVDTPILTASVVSTSALQLAWTPISRATKYVLEVKDIPSGAFKAVAQLPVGTLTYLANDLTPNTTYTFRIKALNKSLESDWYQTDGKTAALLVTPAVQATATYANVVKVLWPLVPEAARYTLERQVGGEAAYTIIAQLSAAMLSYTDTLVKDNSLYTYRVKATNQYTSSPYGSVTVQTPAFLALPELTATVLHNDALAISWKSISNATSYQLERKSAGEAFRKLGTFGATSTVVRDTNLLAGTTYTYRLKAIGDRTESPTASVSATTPSLLDTPTISLTAVYNNAIKVAWTVVPNATAYQVERKAPNQNYRAIGTFKPGVVAVSDTNLTPGTVYTYRIVAIGDRTESPTVSTSITTPNLLETPTLQVTATSFDKLTVSWKAVPTAMYYKLERQLLGAATYQDAIRIEPQQSEYSDTQLVPNTSYRYRLIAYGDKTQSLSTVASGTTLMLLATSQDPAITLHLWPNPAVGGQVSLRFSGPVSGMLRVVDTRGAVQQQQILVNVTQMPLSLPNCPAGVYLIQINQPTGVISQRLLIN